MHISSKVVILSTVLLCTACGSYNLGHVRSQPGKPLEQQQLDVLVCKDQAKVAVSSAERQAGNFLLGMTLIGAPVAYESEKSAARAVFTQCMRTKGYTVAAATD